MMKLKQWMHVILVGCSVMTLAACSAHKNRDTVAINDANSAYTQNDDAQAQGLGNESRFNDHTTVSENGKRVYYFDYDSNVVHSNDVPAIAANANQISNSGRSKVMLEGHTDPRGSREYNIGLGERRAKSVAEILMEKGVNPSQIRVVSYGAEKLASAGQNESAYSKDRRVALVYLQR
jgi:peptidoglycan-associated lipoprotein